MEQQGTFNRTMYQFSQKIDIIQTVLIGLIAFLVPTFLAQIINVIFSTQSVIATNSQLLVGAIVNTVLIISAINVKGWKKILGIITMPSISTIVGGTIFGTSSVYMVYMIPAIWLGNLALVYAYKLVMLEKHKHYFLAGALGIMVKVFVIFGCFELLKLCGLFPDKVVSILQIAMGSTQAITATLGMVMAFMIYQIEKKSCKQVSKNVQ